MRITTTAFVGLAAVFLASSPSASNAQSCAPADTILTPAFNDMKQLVVSTRPADVDIRQRLAIPTVDSSQVTVVSDTRVCDKVLAAFKSSLESGIPLPTKLFVMKVSTVYVALYPETGKEADIYRVMSNKYAILSKFAQ